MNEAQKIRDLESKVRNLENQIKAIHKCLKVLDPTFQTPGFSYNGKFEGPLV